MINYFIHFLLFGSIIFIICYQHWWSKMARSTNELVKLNKIWDDYNNRQNVIYTKIQLDKKKWIYHKDKVELLESFLDANKVINKIVDKRIEK